MLEAIVSDVHWPGENKLLWKLAKKILKKLQPDLLVFLGDCCDPSAISHWEKDGAIRQKLQEQLDYSARKLSEVRADLPNARLKFYRGNHELWLEKFLLDHAPELKDLRAMHPRQLLRLDEFQIEYLEKPFWIGDLYHLHGHELKLKSSGVYPAKNIYNKFFVNLKAVLGHFHVMNAYHHSYQLGSQTANAGVWINGTMIDIKQVEYAFLPSWQASVTLCRYSQQGRSFIEQVQLFENGNRAYCWLWGELIEVEKSGPSGPSGKSGKNKCSKQSTNNSSQESKPAATLLD